MNSNRILQAKKKAFTLVEVLVVVAIISILFVVLVSRVDFATDKAKIAGVNTDFRSFQVALDQVARENNGFNMFGYNTGDNAGAIPTGYAFENDDLRKATMGDGKRNSFDEGDKNLNGKEDVGEVFTGHRIHTEHWTETYTFVKPGSGVSTYDEEAIARLENAINEILDDELHISIGIDGSILMANQARDPWKNEYVGKYISNSTEDGGIDRGAIVIYSAGANGVLHSQASISEGVVKVVNPGGDKLGQDDLSIVSCYTFVNGHGEVQNLTTGFSENQKFNITGSGNGITALPNGTGNGAATGGGHTMLDAPSGKVMKSMQLRFRSDADFEKFQGVKIDGITIASYYYSVIPGSTIVTLNGSYVNELSNGVHTIEIVSTDSTAKTTFTIMLSCRDHEDYYQNYGGEDGDDYDWADGLCDYCGVYFCYHYSCDDFDYDCHCDWCGYDECFHDDADADGYCNTCTAVYCGYGAYPCHDDDFDCYCDFCGESQHFDTENRDGYCDRCDEVWCYDGGPCHPVYWDCYCGSCYDTVHHITDDSCVCTMCWADFHSDVEPNGYCDSCDDILGCWYGGPCIWMDGDCWSCCCGSSRHIGYEEDGMCDQCHEVPCWETGIHTSLGSTCSCYGCGSYIHVDLNYDGVCETCDSVYCSEGGWCVDIDGDCRCDGCDGDYDSISGEYFHYDSDQDSYCDNCSTIYCYDGGGCRSDSGDCYCSWCGDSLHFDTDLDGYCNNCYDVWCYDGGDCHPYFNSYSNCCYCECCGDYMHYDDDDNCVCDNCGNPLHRDGAGGTNTGYCSFCNVVYCGDGGPCHDNDGNCRCDWCSGTTHTDNDGNNYCDVCSKICQDGKSFDSAFIITKGEKLTAKIGTAGQYVYFKFTATTSGTYKFYSSYSTSCDPYGHLYGSNKSEITSNDDGAGNRNFSISRYLSAGETVYIAVRLYSRTLTGTFYVHVG